MTLTMTVMRLVYLDIFRKRIDAIREVFRGLDLINFIFFEQETSTCQGNKQQERQTTINTKIATLQLNLRFFVALLHF
jgi:hypothetical protein